MENKRLHIEATEEAITVYWEKMAGEQGLRYRIYLNGTQAAETEKKNTVYITMHLFMTFRLPPS